MKYVCVMMLMIFHYSSSESLQVVGSDVSIYAEYGSNIILPCWIEPNTSALDMKVEWLRPDQKLTIVHLYKDHNISNTDQIPSYSGRTYLLQEGLQKGNTSLLLTAVQLSDDGDYTCYITASNLNDGITVQLKVEVVGTDPVITLEKYDTSGGFSLLCESKGWYPEPELQWMGNEGINLTGGAAKTHRDGELFNVKHRIYVPSGASNRFYCRVKLRHHMKESEIIISDQIFSTWKAAVIGGSVACVIIIIAVGVCVMIWKVRRLREDDDEKVRLWREEDAKKVLQVQIYVKEEGDSNRLAGVSLSPPQWAALSVALCNSEKEREEFVLRKYSPSHEALVRLQQVIKSTKKAELEGCSLSAESCSVLSSVLSSGSCSLIELNLSLNKLEDSGVKFLCSALKQQECKLNILRLEGCSLSAESCSVLSLVLSSGSCSLIDLDLTNNKLEDSGVEFLCSALKQQECKLNKLRLDGCSLSAESCSVLSSVLSSGSCSLIDLELDNNNLEDSGVKFLCSGLKQPQCKLNKLRMMGCEITDAGCSDLAEALKSNPSSNLRELYLMCRHPGGPGVKKLRDLKENPNCKLEELGFGWHYNIVEVRT